MIPAICRKSKWLLSSLCSFWMHGVDDRVYAIVRISFAIAGLANLINLWPHRHSLLAADGMIDHGILRKAIGVQPYWTLFVHFDSHAHVTTICVIAGLALFFLATGIATRLCAIIVYVWHVSFCNAAFPALVGWDSLLRVYSFLLMVSPLGLTWTVRIFFRTELPQVSFAPAYGLQLMRFQLIAIYADTVWAKVDDPYWRSGEFMAYFMMSQYSNFPSSEWANLRLLSCLLTWGALAAEAAIPLLFMIRSKRSIALVLGLLLHGGIAVTSNLWLFSVCMLAVYPAFLRDEDFPRIVAAYQRVVWLFRGRRTHTD